MEDDISTALTTTQAPAAQPGCYMNGNYYANGADIVTEDPCEHCYCLNGDVVCAIQVKYLHVLKYFHVLKYIYPGVHGTPRGENRQL